MLRIWTAGLLIAAALATPAWAQSDRSSAPPKPPFPVLELPEKARGQRAIDLLGGRLPELAAWYGKSPAEFAAILRRDRNAWLDRQGRVFYQEDLDAPLQADGPASAPSLTASGNLAPLDQTFTLHSRPGSKRTIYLNFKGATLSNTAWNTPTSPTITALPFDTDGVPYSFSTAELERIQYIWQRVAEDFAPFDVDVTTELPSSDRLTRSGSGDDIYGTTVLITKRTFYDCSCGGVAYLGVFDNTSDYYKPALVFYDMLGSGNEKYVAEAASHEAGHNVGLHHDGTSTQGYYTGHGTGATGWAPIMGVGYYQSLVQWSKGEYPGANNKEDDYAVMASNGVAARADDHGNTTGTASRIAGATSAGVTTLEAGGFIERTGDVDVFSFVAAAGPISISVAPARRSPNLDARVELRDGSGNLLVSGNPGDALGATLSVTGGGGTYFVVVTGVGKGDLSTGYSNYGSLGEYLLSGTVPAATSQPPVAVLSAAPTSGVAPLMVNFSSAGSGDPDGSIARIEWTFGDGSAAGPGARRRPLVCDAGRVHGHSEGDRQRRTDRHKECLHQRQCAGGSAVDARGRHHGHAACVPQRQCRGDGAGHGTRRQRQRRARRDRHRNLERCRKRLRQRTDRVEWRGVIQVGANESHWLVHVHGERGDAVRVPVRALEQHRGERQRDPLAGLRRASAVPIGHDAVVPLGGADRDQLVHAVRNHFIERLPEVALVDHREVTRASQMLHQAVERQRARIQQIELDQHLRHLPRIAGRIGGEGCKALACTQQRGGHIPERRTVPGYDELGVESGDQIEHRTLFGEARVPFDFRKDRAEPVLPQGIG